MIRGESDKTSVNIQARSFMARSLDQNVKKCYAEGETNGRMQKPKLDNARRSRGIYFIDPEDKEFK